MRLHVGGGNQHLVGLHAHRNVATRVAPRAARDSGLGLGRSRCKRAVKLLVRAHHAREQVGRVARFAQPFEHGGTGLFKQQVFFR